MRNLMLVAVLHPVIGLFGIMLSLPPLRLSRPLADIRSAVLLLVAAYVLI